MSKVLRNSDGSCPNCGLTVNGMTVKEEKRLLKELKDLEDGKMVTKTSEQLKKELGL